MGRATGGNKEKIQEMPMIEGGKSWAEAGSNPGAYRYVDISCSLGVMKLTCYFAESTLFAKRRMIMTTR